MPELPEVETIKRGLDSRILGKVIKSITVQNAKSFIGNPKAATNLQIKSLARRGKALIINLSNNQSFIIHLRMTGQLIFVDPTSDRFGGGHPTDSFLANLPDRHTRVQITFTDNSNLFFNDQRKFGFVKLLPTNQIDHEKFFQTLGPDSLDPTLTPEQFHARLSKHPNTTIKAAILDQTTLAGVGNIYADEALFFAKIHPARKTSTLTKSESATLLIGIQRSMQASLDSGGSTMATYVKSDGTRGDYLDLFAQVFGKTNQPCPRCKTPIEKTRVAGRGTHFCPKCQQLQSP